MTLTSLTFAIVLGLDPASAAAPKGKGNGPSFGPPPDPKAAAMLMPFAMPESM